MRHQKRTVAIIRARRRVKALEETAAPWPWRARALRQLRKVEAKGVSHARMD
jgi:hypothetical protein